MFLVHAAVKVTNFPCIVNLFPSDQLMFPASLRLKLSSEVTQKFFCAFNFYYSTVTIKTCLLTARNLKSN